MLPKTLIEHWNGTTWSVMTSPNAAGNNFLFGVACPSASSCIAVGHSNNGAGDQTLSERWTGTTWSLMVGVDPATSNDLSAVACPSEPLGSSGSMVTVWILRVVMGHLTGSGADPSLMNQPW